MYRRHHLEHSVCEDEERSEFCCRNVPEFKLYAAPVSSLRSHFQAQTLLTGPCYCIRDPLGRQSPLAAIRPALQIASRPLSTQQRCSRE